MNLDIKHDLFKSLLSESKLSHKNINSTIDQSLVSSTAQKSLGMDLKNQEENNLLKKKKDKEDEKKKKKFLTDEEMRLQKDRSNQIVRDPMKLLNLI